ncbi:MAG TPA: universal stress protein [Candidatus Binatia bacterium]|nr:universal stress protein [Candidatus Binatia bacterium]
MWGVVMFNQVLVPLDGSVVAEQALPFASALARGLHLPVQLLSVVDLSETIAAAEPTRGVAETIEEATRKREAYLKEIARNLEDLPTSWVVERGSAVEGIIENAAKTPGALIAMATHGRSGVKRWLLGSVAEKVLRGSSNPLLLVRAAENRRGGELPLRCLIVPLDGSELAETILPIATHVASSLGIELVLARACEIPATAYYRSEDFQGAEAFIPSYEEMLAAATEEARSYLENKLEELRRQGITRARSVMLHGSAAEEIIELGRSTEGSLIAICTHGRSGVMRWILGSVASKVLQGATHPLLVVRPTASRRSAFRPELKNLIVGLDGSELAERVLPYASAFAKKLNLSMVLLRVCETPIDAWQVRRKNFAHRLAQRQALLEKRAQDYLEAKANQLRSSLEIHQVATKVVLGYPASALVDMAEKNPGNMVAMTTHGRSGFGRWIMGSVAEKVIHHSRAPVLLVRSSERGLSPGGGFC